MKFLIFDSGPLISLTMNGLLPVLEKLKKEFNGEFVITQDVKHEVIDRPLGIKKYEFEGLKIKDLLDRGILSLSSKFISHHKLEKETYNLLNITNDLFYAEGEKIKLVHKGEASCLAFSKLCGGENVIVIDERTTRMLTEAPENLKKMMEKKLNTNIKINQNNLKFLKNFKFIRSAELLYIAYKKNLFNLKKDKILLDSLLYAVKYKGAAISSKEIEEIKRLG